MKRMLAVLLCTAMLVSAMGCSRIIGHYVPLGGGEVYTKSFPIRMVNTEDGWRFAEFNITL